MRILLAVLALAPLALRAEGLHLRGHSELQVGKTGHDGSFSKCGIPSLDGKRD
jgi:hypothetical protein